MVLGIKKLHPDAKVPRAYSLGDAGLDLCSVIDVDLKPGERISCPTGIAVELPIGFVGLVWDKGTPSHKFGIKTLGGVFDCGYRGEYFVGLVNLSIEIFHIKKGQEIAQLLIQKVEMPKIVEIDELSGSERGDTAFASLD